MTERWDLEGGEVRLILESDGKVWWNPRRLPWDRAAVYNSVAVLIEERERDLANLERALRGLGCERGCHATPKFLSVVPGSRGFTGWVCGKCGLTIEEGDRA